VVVLGRAVGMQNDGNRARILVIFAFTACNFSFHRQIFKN